MLRLIAIAAIAVFCTTLTPLPGLAQSELRVTVERRIPVVGEELVVGVRYIDGAEDDIAGVELTAVRDDARIDLGTPQMQPQEDGSLWGTVTWTPEQDGFYQLSARATSDDGELTAEREIAVTSRALHFVWYGHGPDLQWATAVTPPPGDEATRLLYRDRGIRLLDWQGARHETAEAAASSWTGYGDDDGIAIDEIGFYDRTVSAETRASALFEALGLFKEQKPEGFLAVWHAGSLTVPAANAYREHADLAMLEGYRQYARGAFNTHSFYDYIDQRVEMARRMDVLEKCVVGLGITRAKGGVTEAEIRRSVEHVRLVAPESPGLAWFRHADADRVDPEILQAADAVALEYFVKPCLMVRNWDIQAVPGDPPRICANVHNIGGTSAHDVGVAFYAGHPDHGGRLIGREFLPVLRAGGGWSDDLETLPAEEAKSSAYGLRQVSVPLEPGDVSGDIWVRIWAPDATLLQDIAHRRVVLP